MLCYTEKAPNAWHRRGTKKTGNTYNQRNRPNRHASQTKHQALPKGQPGRRVTPVTSCAGGSVVANTATYVHLFKLAQCMPQWPQSMRQCCRPRHAHWLAVWADGRTCGEPCMLHQTMHAVRTACRRGHTNVARTRCAALPWGWAGRLVRVGRALLGPRCRRWCGLAAGHACHLCRCCSRGARVCVRVGIAGWLVARAFRERVRMNVP